MSYLNEPTKDRSGLKDIWNAFMCEGARYSLHDIPLCPTILTGVPKAIIPWDEAKAIHSKEHKINPEYHQDSFVCFYLDDYKFDGPQSSIWLFPKKAMEVLCHFRGIITPDFSTYQDFPEPIKTYNTFRMRAFGYWAGKQGLEVCNNVRWGTPESYEYCFDGIEPGVPVCIGTVGGSPRKRMDRKRFEAGLQELVRRLNPPSIWTYGSSRYSCFNDLQKSEIEIVSYESHTAKAFRRSCHE